MDKIAPLYLAAAKTLGLPIKYHQEYEGVEINLGSKRHIFRGGFTPFNDSVSSDIAFNKFCVNLILHQAGLPVPKATVVSKANYIQGNWHLPPLTYPIVAKPTFNPFGGGLDVFCNIQDQPTLITYLEKKLEKYNFISLEKFESGLRAYRVLVFFDKVIGLVRRDPACVIGDGIHTIKELIEIENEKRAIIHDVSLGKLTVDKEYETKLNEMKLNIFYIPALHEKIVLCYTCNSMRGGTMTSIGIKNICPENNKLFRQAARILNLNLVGFDILCEDIQNPIEKSRGFFIEANCNPDITIHEAPMCGIRVPVATTILRRLIYQHPFSYLHSYVKQKVSTHIIFYRYLFILGLIIGVIKFLTHT